MSLQMENIVDFSSIVVCRLCEESSLSTKYVFIRDNFILLNHIKDLLQIEIDFSTIRESFLPRQICESCLDSLETFRRFREKSQAANSKWITMIEKSKNLLINTKEIKIEVISAPNNSTVDISFNQIPFSDQNNIMEIEPVVSSSLNGNLENCYIEPKNQSESKVTIPSVSTNATSIKPSYLKTNGHIQDTICSWNRNIKKTSSGRFTCNFCMESFQWRYRAEHHIKKEHTKDTPFIYGQCNKEFNTLQYLKGHEMTDHNAEIDKRQKYDREFGGKYLPNEHEIEHQGNPQILCPDCGLKFYEIIQLTAHIRNSHGCQYICEACGKSTRTKIHLEQHRLSHNSDKKFGCTLCKKKFVDKRGLICHTTQHRSDLPFKCEACGMTFRHKKGLVFHARFCKKN